jgi:hypothetical protein
MCGGPTLSLDSPLLKRKRFSVLHWRLDFVPVMKQSCGVAKSKRKNSKNSKRAAFPKNPPKTLVYDALAVLNRDFEQLLGDLQRLEALCLFPLRWQRKFLEAWRATLEETRAWANFEVIEVLHQKEERDWVGFGRIRQRSEKPSASPADVSVPTKSSVRKSPRRK